MMTPQCWHVLQLLTSDLVPNAYSTLKESELPHPAAQCSCDGAGKEDRCATWARQPCCCMLWTPAVLTPPGTQSCECHLHAHAGEAWIPDADPNRGYVRAA